MATEKTVSLPVFTPKRWDHLAEELERAYQLVPFTSFKIAKAMCRTLASLAELDNAMAGRVPKPATKENQ
jgi:hypothetical protein